MYILIKKILLQNTKHSSIFGQTRISFAKNFVFSHSQLPVFVLFFHEIELYSFFFGVHLEKTGETITGYSW